MIYNDLNNCVSLTDYNGFNLYQAYNPINHQPFNNKEELKNWIIDYLKSLFNNRILELIITTNLVNSESNEYEIYLQTDSDINFNCELKLIKQYTKEEVSTINIEFVNGIATSTIQLNEPGNYMFLINEANVDDQNYIFLYHYDQSIITI